MKRKLLIVICGLLAILFLLNPSIKNLRENISNHINYPPEFIKKRTTVYRTKNFLVCSFYVIETNGWHEEIEGRYHRHEKEKFHNITSVFGILGNTYTLSSTTVDIN